MTISMLDGVCSFKKKYVPFLPPLSPKSLTRFPLEYLSMNTSY